MVTRSALRDQLPPFGREFVNEHPSALAAVALFHQWLKRSYRPILQLEPCEINGFLDDIQRLTAADHVRSRYRRIVLRYFDWLHARSLLRFDPRLAWPRSAPIPLLAQQYLESLKPTRKTSTINGRQSNLRQFHVWISSERVALEQLERRHVEGWLGWLHARGLHPSTRLAAIQTIRAYLDWLSQQGVISSIAAETLIRSTDLPKLPQYLPRPIPKEMDTALQQRLRRSRSTYQLGLLLMRRTGLRISELIALPYDCTQTDARGNHLLKVPLGKLDTERLVPLDTQTVKLVAKLRRKSRRKHHWLLQTPTGKKTRYESYRLALSDACRGFAFAEPMTTHRLRHTYATTLLAGGMNLPSVMRLLGHRDYRMTLRYAAVTDETVIREYTAALEKAESLYASPTPPPASPLSTSDPRHLLADAARYLAKRVRDQSIDAQKAKPLITRLRRLDTAFRKLLRRTAR